MDFLGTAAPHLPPQYLTVSDVASILSVSDDTILKQFGVARWRNRYRHPSTMHRRRKRILRIPRHTLDQYISDRQVKVRRR